jgi:hypothetical protein
MEQFCNGNGSYWNCSLMEILCDENYSILETFCKGIVVKCNLTAKELIRTN